MLTCPTILMVLGGQGIEKFLSHAKAAHPIDKLFFDLLP